MGFVLQLKAPQLGRVPGLQGTQPVGGAVGVCWECRLGMGGMRAPLRVMDGVLRTPDPFLLVKQKVVLKVTKVSPPLPN